MKKLSAILPALCLLFLPPPRLCAEPAAPDANTRARTALRAVASGTAPADASRPLDEPARRLFEKWIQTHADAVTGTQPGPLKDLPWGVCTFRPAAKDRPARLYLLVFDWHASGKLMVYGLTGGVRRATLLASPDTALPLEKTPRGLVITVPREPPDPLATVVVLELEGEPQITPLAIHPGADDRIVLHARDAIVHGRTVRYEPEPHKNTVGYWMDPADYVRWPFVVAKAGAYAVDIEQGCGKGQGGSEVEFVCGGRTLKVVVEDTGHFQNFVTRRIGEFRFDRPGEYALEVRPTRKAGVAVMDLRSVTLTPLR